MAPTACVGPEKNIAEDWAPFPADGILVIPGPWDKSFSDMETHRLGGFKACPDFAYSFSNLNRLSWSKIAGANDAMHAIEEQTIGANWP
jgi:hypothetical protein